MGSNIQARMLLLEGESSKVPWPEHERVISTRTTNSIYNIGKCLKIRQNVLYYVVFISSW